MKPYELGLYEKAMPNWLTILEKLKHAKTAGFDYVEVSIDETNEKLSRLNWGREERKRLVDDMYNAGIFFRSMCLSGHRKYPLGSLEQAVNNRSLEIMEQAVQFAADLGIRTIQLAGYDVYYEESNSETKEIFLNNLKRSVNMAASAGILLGFETMETEFMNTVEKAMKYIHQIDSEYLGVYPDLGNITNASKTYGTEVTEDLRRGKGHLIAMHLKETVPSVFREVPYGTGHVDFEKGINVAWELGIRRYVAEFWYTGSKTWIEGLYQANTMMRNILDCKKGIFDI